MSARPRNGLLIQGGVSSGKTVRDNCEIQAQVPEAVLAAGATITAGIASAPNVAYCHTETPFLTSEGARRLYDSAS